MKELQLRGDSSCNGFLATSLPKEPLRFTINKLNHKSRSAMNIICTICSDLLTAENSVSTVCGHVFHGNCLEEWFKNG